MQIIRGRLSAADFSNPALRYNPDTDTVQYTPDGGTTWVDDPSDDPRHGAKFAKPLKTTGDIRCDSAASMVKWIRDFITYEADILSTGAQVVALGNTALSFFTILAPWAILVQGLINLAGVLFGIGSGTLNAAFNDDVYDAMLCCFYCHIGDDGTVTAGNLEDIQAQVNINLSTIAALVTNLILSNQGEMGLQNAGTLYALDGDCSGCDCGWQLCWPWIDEEALNGFTAFHGTWSLTNGYEGVFINSSAKSVVELDGDILATPARFRHIEITYSAAMDVGTGGAVQIDGYLSGTRTVHHTQTTNGSHIVFAWDGDEMFDEIVLAINSGSDATTAKIESALMSGSGDAPPIGTAC